MGPEKFDIREFIIGGYDPVKTDVDFPNARKFLTGSIFISHAGADFHRVLDQISPPVYDRFADGYFLHNRRSGGSERYRELVRAALHLCDKFMVVISEQSITNEWVRAEVDWAVRQKRSIIQCLLDESTPDQMHPTLSLQSSDSPEELFTVDFRGELESARSRLADILDRLLLRSPYPRFPNGRPGWRAEG